jgi:hypothetical protein
MNLLRNGVTEQHRRNAGAQFIDYLEKREQMTAAARPRQLLERDAKPRDNCENDGNNQTTDAQHPHPFRAINSPGDLAVDRLHERANSFHDLIGKSPTQPAKNTQKDSA